MFRRHRRPPHVHEHHPQALRLAMTSPREQLAQQRLERLTIDVLVDRRENVGVRCGERGPGDRGKLLAQVVIGVAGALEGIACRAGCGPTAGLT